MDFCFNVLECEYNVMYVSISDDSMQLINYYHAFAVLLLMQMLMQIKACVYPRQVLIFFSTN